MIPISLPSGKVYYARSLDEALNLDYQELIANDIGMDINDPFYGSSIDVDQNGRERRINDREPLIFETPDISGVEEINPED